MQDIGVWRSERAVVMGETQVLTTSSAPVAVTGSSSGRRCSGFGAFQFVARILRL